MKRLLVLAGMVGFLLGSETVLSAGVVMSETATASGPIQNGRQHRTIYVQDNKRKVDTDGVQTITDLDKGLLYLIDKNRRNFFEVPLRSLSEAAPGWDEPNTEAIVLKRTGATRVVADDHCDEYSGNAGNDQVRLAVSACVSRDAPGLEEMDRFDRKMISRLRGLKPKNSTEQSTGIVLEKKSVINLRLPGTSQQGYRFASQITKTRVDSVKIKPLPAQTFTPPNGYKKVERHPEGNSPDDAQPIMQEMTPSQPVPLARSTHSGV